MRIRPRSWLLGLLWLAAVGGLVLLVGIMSGPNPVVSSGGTPTGRGSGSSPRSDNNRSDDHEGELARLRNELAALREQLADQDQRHRSELDALTARLAALESAPPQAHPPADTTNRPGPSREDLRRAAQEAAAREIEQWKRQRILQDLRRSFLETMAGMDRGGVISLDAATRAALAEAFDRAAGPMLAGDQGDDPGAWDFGPLLARVPAIVGDTSGTRIGDRLRYEDGDFDFDFELVDVDRGQFPWLGNVSGHMLPVQRHVYTVHVAEDGVTRFHARWAPATVDVDMELTRDGTTVREADSSEDGSERMDVPLAAGVYQLTVFVYLDEDTPAEAVDYQLTWSRVPVDSLEPGVDFQGALNPGESRVHRVELAGGDYRLELFGFPEERDIDVTVTTASGVAIGTGEESTGRETVPFRTGPGVHFVRVQNLTGEPVTFRLRIDTGDN